MSLGETIGSIIAIFIILVLLAGGWIVATNITTNQTLAYETEKSFCPEGKTYESAGFGGSITFCKGKQYTCSIKECYWITDKQEATK